jgi:hypothetical protein
LLMMLDFSIPYIWKISCSVGEQSDGMIQDKYDRSFKKPDESQSRTRLRVISLVMGSVSFTPDGYYPAP